MENETKTGKEVLDQIKAREEINKINKELIEIDEKIKELNSKTVELIEKRNYLKKIAQGTHTEEQKDTVSSTQQPAHHHVHSEEDSILIVDDDRMARKLLSKLVDKNLYKIFEASSAAEALEILESRKFNLAIVDIFMEDMDGLTFVMKAREKKECENMPVVMCTSSDKKVHIAAAARMGVVDYIIKPFNFEVAKARIEKVLDRV